MALTLACVSDTHGARPHVPPADVLIHAGDLTRVGTLPEIRDAAAWLASLPHPHKVVVAGNHDFALDAALRGADARAAARCAIEEAGCVYLDGETATVAGLSVHGEARTPRFYDWAFMYDRESDVARGVWDRVPAGIDVLVSHGPAQEILDTTYAGIRAGCEVLARELERIRPRVHVFGHIHEAHGAMQRGATLHVNAACWRDRTGWVVDWDGLTASPA
jgi:Icc-related predicted phosphoesterase